MNTNDLYYKKYLKYKSKYLELRGSGQVGGLKQCPNFVIKRFTSFYRLIKEYDCTYDKIADNFNKFTHAEFDAANIRHPDNPLTIPELKERGFPLDFFQDFEYDHSGRIKRNYPKQLLIAPYIDEIKKHSGYFNVTDFKNATFDVEKLKKAGYTVKILISIGFPADEIRVSFTSDKITDGLKQIKQNQIRSLESLKKLGFTLEELYKSHHNKYIINLEDVSNFRHLYSLKELKDIGFTADDLCKTYHKDELNVNKLREFIEVGYKVSELFAFDCTILEKGGFTVSELFNAIPSTYVNTTSAKYFHEKGISDDKLEEEGFGRYLEQTDE